MRHILLLIIGMAFFYTSHAQVTIGSNYIPNSGTLLDLKETNTGTSMRGLGLPRVELSRIKQLFPMFGEEGNVINDYDTQKASIDEVHIGLVVYNVHTNLDESLCPGVYLWQGDTWVRIPEPCTPPLVLLNSPNSYIVEPGTSVDIPCGKPYLVAQQRSDLPPINLTDKASVELLWQDAQNLIDNVELVGDNNGPYSTFRVTTKPSEETGNALVALRMGPNGNASDPIVWSWHIWVVGYNPNSIETSYTYNNGEQNYTFMDRNLGALSTSATNSNSTGLVYQWGRKDPFSGASGFSPQADPKVLYNKDNVALTELDEIKNGASGTGIKHILASVADPTAPNNLAYSIKSPTTFLYGKYENPSKPMDWFPINDANQPGDDTLWGASGTKSAFDPCPQGWRVPAYSTTLSPWFPYEGTSSGWGGYHNPYVLDDPSNNGANLVGKASSLNALGFYPYASFRRPREIPSGGSVGGSTEYLVGGAFSDSNFINANGRETLYWSANPKSDDANAKAFKLWIDYSFPGMDEVESKMENYSRAAGASVRCVKDVTTP